MQQSLFPGHGNTGRRVGIHRSVIGLEKHTDPIGGRIGGLHRGGNRETKTVEQDF